MDSVSVRQTLSTLEINKVEAILQSASERFLLSLEFPPTATATRIATASPHRLGMSMTGRFLRIFHPKTANVVVCGFVIGVREQALSFVEASSATNAAGNYLSLE